MSMSVAFFPFYHLGRDGWKSVSACLPFLPVMADEKLGLICIAIFLVVNDIEESDISMNITHDYFHLGVLL